MEYLRNQSSLVPLKNSIPIFDIDEEKTKQRKYSMVIERSPLLFICRNTF